MNAPRTLADVRRDLGDVRDRLAGIRAVLGTADRELASARTADAGARAAVAIVQGEKRTVEAAYASDPSEANLSRYQSVDARDRLLSGRANITGRALTAAGANQSTAVSAVERVQGEIASLEGEIREHPETIRARVDPLVKRLVAGVEEVATVLGELRTIRGELVADRPGVHCGEHHALLLGVERVLAARGIVPEDCERSALLEAVSWTSTRVNPFAAVNAVWRVLSRKPCENRARLDEYRREVQARGLFHDAASAAVYLTSPAVPLPVDPRVVESLAKDCAVLNLPQHRQGFVARVVARILPDRLVKAAE